MSSLKQVIVMRTDLNIGRGKMVAQGAHASGMFLVERLTELASDYHAKVPPEEMLWMMQGMTKICVAAKAQEAGLRVHVIIDAGRTEFGGIPTRTSLAIGPNDATAIDPITRHLRLL
jgi:PTH2 family peptidyl-tRNA hydrolase